MLSAEQLLNRELAARISAGPEGRSAVASLHTVSCILASTLSYYVATQIAWILFVVAAVLFIVHLVTGRTRPTI